MIVKGLFELVFMLLSVVFAPINLPDLPPGIQSVVDEFMNILLSGFGLVSVFINFQTLKWLIPVLVVVINLDKVWTLIMFILRKIPFLGIK